VQPRTQIHIRQPEVPSNGEVQDDERGNSPRDPSIRRIQASVNLVEYKALLLAGRDRQFIPLRSVNRSRRTIPAVCYNTWNSVIVVVFSLSDLQFCDTTAIINFIQRIDAKRTPCPPIGSDLRRRAVSQPLPGTRWKQE